MFRHTLPAALFLDARLPDALFFTRTLVNSFFLDALYETPGCSKYIHLMCLISLYVLFSDAPKYIAIKHLCP